jgi:ribosomal protein L32
MGKYKRTKYPSKHKRRIQAALTALVLIKEKEGKKKGITGTIECPECGNQLNYTISEVNGHVTAWCKTKNCVKFIQ